MIFQTQNIEEGKNQLRYFVIIVNHIFGKLHITFYMDQNAAAIGK